MYWVAINETGEVSEDLDAWDCSWSSDPPKSSAVSALRRLAELGITTKVVTGDNAAVARRVCAEMGPPLGRRRHRSRYRCRGRR